MKFIQQTLFALVCFLVLSFSSAQDAEFLDGNNLRELGTAPQFTPCNRGSQCKSGICANFSCA